MSCLTSMDSLSFAEEKVFSSDSDEAAAVFYNRLFELDPDLEDLFTGDMKEQGRKLMTRRWAGRRTRRRNTPRRAKIARRHRPRCCAS